MGATTIDVQSTSLPSEKIVFSVMDHLNGNQVLLNGSGNIHLLLKNGLSGGASVQATGTISDLSALPADGDTVTIGNKIYKFKTELTPLEGEVLIDTTEALTLANLKSAINLSSGNGTTYYCAAANDEVVATTLTSTALTVQSKARGTAGNSIVLTTTSTNITVSGSGTLSCGVNATTDIIVTLVATGTCNYGYLHDVVMTVPEGETWDTGLLTPPRRFQDSSKYVQLKYSGATPDSNCLIAAIAEG